MMQIHASGVRPRPPAQTRRSGSTPLRWNSVGTPPPPYASGQLAFPADESMHDSLGPIIDEDVEDWQEKSREELSELLVKATGIIKDREVGKYPVYLFNYS
jgi:hypothetical protein